MRRGSPALLSILVACGHTKGPATSVAEVWAWSLEDRPYLMLTEAGTLTHQGAVVGTLDVRRRTLTLPPRIQDMPLDEIGDISVAVPMTEFRIRGEPWGVDGSGVIYVAPPSTSDGGPAERRPWGSIRPAKVSEPVRTGLVWAAMLAETPQAAVASVRIWADEPCVFDVRAEASALGDGRLVDTAVCSTEWTCDLGEVVGRWSADGTLASEALGGAVDVGTQVRGTPGGSWDVVPVGEVDPWFTVNAQGRWVVADPGDLYRGTFGLAGSVSGAGGDGTGLASVDSRAAATYAGTVAARRVRDALTECTREVPPPPPPPPIR